MTDRQRIRLTGSPVICTRSGGGKPRVCSSSYQVHNSFLVREGCDLTLSADIPGDDDQQDSLVPLRVGRAVVPVALRFAKDIIAGGVAPELDLHVTQAGHARWTIIFHRVEVVGGFERRVRASFVAVTDRPEDKPDIPRSKILAVGNFIKAAAEHLHGSLG